MQVQTAGDVATALELAWASSTLTCCSATWACPMAAAWT